MGLYLPTCPGAPLLIQLVLFSAVVSEGLSPPVPPSTPQSRAMPWLHALPNFPRAPELVGDGGSELPAAAAPGHHRRWELPAPRCLPG